MPSKPEDWPQQPIPVLDRSEIGKWTERLVCHCGGALETKLQAAAHGASGLLDFLTLGCSSCQKEHELVFLIDEAQNTPTP